MSAQFRGVAADLAPSRSGRCRQRSCQQSTAFGIAWDRFAATSTLTRSFQQTWHTFLRRNLHG
jgi:hypothetical protein